MSKTQEVTIQYLHYNMTLFIEELNWRGAVYSSHALKIFNEKLPVYYCYLEKHGFYTYTFCTRQEKLALLLQGYIVKDVITIKKKLNATTFKGEANIEELKKWRLNNV